MDEVLRRPGLNSFGWDASRVDYVYDALGRLTKETRLISNPFGALYSPDLDWLSQVNQASFLRNGYVVDYTLDLVGNRVEQVRKQSTYTAYRSTSETVSYERTTSQFDARDRLFSEVGESRPTTTAAWSPLFDVDYLYDANGSLESKTRTGTLPETTTYEFDVRNRLAATERNSLVPIGTTTATQPQTLVGQYVYDDAGIRTRVRETTTTGSGASAVVKTTITDYLVDHQSPTGYAQAIEERTTTGTGTVAAPPNVSPPLSTALPSVSYVFGHELLTQARQGATATSQPRTAVYRHDAHSGVRQLAGGDTTYPTTTVVYDNYTYEAFGTLLPNPSQITNRGTTNTHLYRGETWDAGLGLTYLRARYVDHKTGRFASSDPFEGFLTQPESLPRYTYTYNDPLNQTDPSGENPAAFGVFIAASAFLGGVSGAVVGGILGGSQGAIQGAIGGALGSTAFALGAIGFGYGASLLIPSISVAEGTAMASAVGVGYSIQQTLAYMMEAETWRERIAASVALAFQLGGLGYSVRSQIIYQRSLLIEATQQYSPKSLPKPTWKDTGEPLTNSEFGEVMQWGSRSDGFGRAQTLKRADLLENSARTVITAEIARAWRDFYIAEAASGFNNPSAPGRAVLMQRAVELLTDPPLPPVVISTPE